MRLLAVAALLLSAPAFAQSGGASAGPFLYDVTVGTSGAYFGGFGIDSEIRLRPHVAARIGAGITAVNPFSQTVDPGLRATLVGVVGGPRQEFQAGVGATAAWATVYKNGPAGRSLAVVPHVYGGTRLVLAFGDTPDGTPAPAPHLALRVGGMVTVGEPGTDGPRVRPEIGVGVAF